MKHGLSEKTVRMFKIRTAKQRILQSQMRLYLRCSILYLHSTAFWK